LQKNIALLQNRNEALRKSRIRQGRRNNGGAIPESGGIVNFFFGAASPRQAGCRCRRADWQNLRYPTKIRAIFLV